MLTLSFGEGVLLGDKACDAVGSLPVLGPRVLIHGVHRVIVDTCTRRFNVNTTGTHKKAWNLAAIYEKDGTWQLFMTYYTFI
jgi:hypothetical protein